MLLERISKNLGIDVEYLLKVANNASFMYKRYTIPKHNGKERVIDHPARPLKVIQREIVRQIFSKFPTHASVYSYKKKCGIGDIAKLHQNSNYLSRFDFSNFFPSITDQDILNFLCSDNSQYYEQMSSRDASIVAKLVTRNGELTIGAPSSPSISNTILFDFDSACYEYAYSKQAIYSRYADDLYISAERPNILKPVCSHIITSLLGKAIPRLSLNRKKSIFTSRKRLRMVTGLVITTEHKVSIGREKKRQIRAMVHKFSHNILAPDASLKLKGWITYIDSVEPSFIQGLTKKYPKTIARIMSLEFK